jgi:hypothetical protein
MSAATLSRDVVEQLREPTFIALLFVGATVFALGGAFLVVGIAINTAPPAPYVSPSDRRFLVVGSLLAMVLGGALVRWAARIVGW